MAPEIAENGENLNDSAITENEEILNGFTHPKALNGIEKNYGFGTIAIHSANSPENWDMNQLVPPISLSTTYKQHAIGVPKKHDYARDGNPTRDVLEATLASLEGATYGRVFASGMSATSSLINLLKTGEHIICSDDVYGGTQRYLRRVAEALHGVEVSLVDLTNPKALQAALKPNTKIVWFESPSNPILKVVDILEITKQIKSFNKDILVVVDNTFMSPYFQQPLSLGADVAYHSLTKYINGHTDVCMGAVMTNCPKLAEHLHFMQKAVGAIPSPFDAYLVIRGIKTLHLRMKAHFKNGLAVAKFLEGNPRVEKVLYPELESHPQHVVHKKQTTGMSGMVSFYLKGNLEQVEIFLANLKLFILAESLGGYESLAELPALMTHASVPEAERTVLGITENLIRLSVGIEDTKDLIADLDHALKIAVPEI